MEWREIWYENLGIYTFCTVLDTRTAVGMQSQPRCARYAQEGHHVLWEAVFPPMLWSRVGSQGVLYHSRQHTDQVY